MPHYLERLQAQVEATHTRMGNLVAFAVLVGRAEKCLLIVAPAGTGKSASQAIASRALGESLRIDSVTQSGIKHFESQLNHYKGLVLVDDMGKIDTPYSRLATVKTWCELVYSHEMSKHTVTTHLEITGFHGAVMLNIQPAVLGQVVQADEWEANIADKTVRYYHLFRPQAPARKLPEVEPAPEVRKDSAEMWGENTPAWASLERLMQPQWGDARLQEHLTDLLCTAAALDGRDKVNATDYKVLRELLRPCSIERHLIHKLGFEEGRVFEYNLMAMLVELASWPQLTVDRICRDYRITPDTVRRILSQMPEYFAVDRLGPNRITVSPKVGEILKLAGATVRKEATTPKESGAK